MQIEVTTDHNVDGSAELTSQVAADATAALARFSDQLTRVEVHLGDENADKSGPADKRCMIEARPAGQQPVAVTNHGATLEEACRGALRKRAVSRRSFQRAASAAATAPIGRFGFQGGVAGVMVASWSQLGRPA